MASANIHDLKGAVKGNIEVPALFNEQIRSDLIMRAVLAENTLNFQPQGHYPLAGMNTTARYYGAMNSYRSGRHTGRAIRPRQKLGGGRQGAVRRIPSAVKGKRAHPHVIEKTLIERINRKEYQKAIASAIAATGSAEYVGRKHAVEGVKFPVVVSNEIESIRKTKEMFNLLKSLSLSSDLEKSEKGVLRKGQRRLSQRKHYRKSVLVVVNEDKGAVKAARNVPGVDACTIKDLKANLLAPGGVPGRITVWSENAVKNLAAEIPKLSLE